jgi:hypothetical protein
MPRPAKDDPRVNKFTIRVSNAELAELERRAKAAGCSPTAFARQAIFEEAAALTTGHRPSRDIDAYNLAEQVRRVGVNINQMAHRFNEHGIPPPPDLVKALDEIRQYVSQAHARL